MVAGIRLGKTGLLAAGSTCMLLCGTLVVLSIRDQQLQHRERMSTDRAHIVRETHSRHPRTTDGRDASDDTVLQTPGREPAVPRGTDGKSHGPRRRVVCKPPAQTTDAFKPKLLFIAGIEGKRCMHVQNLSVCLVRQYLLCMHTQQQIIHESCCLPNQWPGTIVDNNV